MLTNSYQGMVFSIRNQAGKLNIIVLMVCADMNFLSVNGMLVISFSSYLVWGCRLLILAICIVCMTLLKGWLEMCVVSFAFNLKGRQWEFEFGIIDSFSDQIMENPA